VGFLAFRASDDVVLCRGCPALSDGTVRCSEDGNVQGFFEIKGGLVEWRLWSAETLGKRAYHLGLAPGCLTPAKGNIGISTRIPTGSDGTVLMEECGAWQKHRMRHIAREIASTLQRHWERWLSPAPSSPRILGLVEFS